MDVKFITTIRNLVDTVPIVDGQVVVCKDHDDLFYDMGQFRHRVGRCMWEPVEEDKITAGFMITDPSLGVFQFVPNEGSDIELQEGTPANFVVGDIGQLVEFTTLPKPTREGYKFLGWFEDQTLQSQRVEVFPSKYPSGKIIYYASWKEI